MWVSKLFYLLFLFNLYGLVVSDDFKDEGLDSKAHSDRSGLWFGPRLGKRSMNDNTMPNTASKDDLSDREQFQKKIIQLIAEFKYIYDLISYAAQKEEVEAKEKIDKLYEKMKNQKDKAAVHGRSLKGLNDKRPDNMDFTPRLGRRLSYDMLPSPYEAERSNDMQLDRSNYFTPRLGRELAYDSYPDRLRFVRSVKTKPTK